MKYIRNTVDFQIEEDTVISLGKFDGIHRGHELLMERLAEKKREGLKAAIFTFDIPPRRNVQHVEAKVLTTNEEKMHIFEEMGIDYLIECPFTEEVMHMEPEDFIRMLVERLHVKCIVAGEDFRFGHSSTFVREEIAAGNIEKANHLLGYRYFVKGMVKHGNQIGRTIGIPTINLIPPEEKLLPPFGVYVSEVAIGEERYQGVTNVGCKPTIEGNNPVGVETYLLDFHENVYDRIVTVEFISKIRAEHKFENIEALKEQMENDIAYTEAYFRNL